MIDNQEQQYLKFPSVLKSKLTSCEIQFPENVEYVYEQIWAYRCIDRNAEDETKISRNDFLSHVEISHASGKPIKKRKGQTTEPDKEIGYYAVSLFKKKEIVENLMHFPRPSKKICSGYVYMEGGPQATDDQHINWWIYEDIDLSDFKIEKGEKNEKRIVF